MTADGFLNVQAAPRRKVIVSVSEESRFVMELSVSDAAVYLLLSVDSMTVSVVCG